MLVLLGLMCGENVVKRQTADLVKISKLPSQKRKRLTLLGFVYILGSHLNQKGGFYA